MKIQTRRLNRDIINDPNDRSVNIYNYINLEEIKEYSQLNDIRYNFIVSGRTSVGKSYAIKMEVIDLILTGKQFLFLRSTKPELATVASWLSEVLPYFDEKMECDHSQIVLGKPYAGAISIEYTRFTDDKEEKNIMHVGHRFSLMGGAETKSGWHENTELLVYEEYNSSEVSYAKKRELKFKFVELYMTFFRERKIPVYFLANNVGGTNPIEQEYANSPHAMKWKIFKKLPKNSAYSGLSSEITDYLEGEAYFNQGKVNIENYILINWVKVGSKNFYIYRHNYMRIGKDSYFITDKGEQHKYETDTYLFTQFYDIDFIFKSNDVEMNFTEQIKNIHEILRTRLPQVRIPLRRIQ